jgi:hypothetical protein
LGIFACAGMALQGDLVPHPAEQRDLSQPFAANCRSRRPADDPCTDGIRCIT